MSGLTPLVVVGDALLDRDLAGRAERLAPDAPVPVVSHLQRTTRPGGAALAAYLAALDGRAVTLVTALGDSPADAELRALLAGRVRLVELPLAGSLPAKTRVMVQGRPLLRLDDGDGRAAGATREAEETLATARAVLVSDYGRGTADVLRAALTAAAARVPVVWDPHPRGGAPVRGARLATPSASEARWFVTAWQGTRGYEGGVPKRDTDPRDEDGGGPGADPGPSHENGTPPDGAPADGPPPDAAPDAAGPGGVPGPSSGAAAVGGGRRPTGTAGAPEGPEGPEGPGGELAVAARDARALIRAWDVTSVVVTLGRHGALLSHGEAPLLVPTPWRAEGDACGAGDRFAATAAGLLADEALPEDAVQGAVHAATRYVANGGAHGLTAGLAPAGAPEAGAGPAGPAGPTGVTGRPVAVREADAAGLAARVRAAGGTVVAAGGCFDLLHAGHVALLEAARRTGDCLLVCVNSDASVRRRKGGGRPLVPAADRVRVLRALECVDAVAVFDDDTPERLLAELRPHIWVKGGDYALAELPEAALVESWGGQVVLLPYLDGRSTTALARRAAGRRDAASAGVPGTSAASVRR
ncbi:D-glycero-beta-D-manno-heptose 1-phosphate adenylyltransferase [Streptomyces sp. NPDC001780]